MGKVACWSTKVAIYLKPVKTEEKLLWKAYRNSPTLFRMVPVPSPTPYGLFYPKIGVRNPHPKVQSIVSGTDDATDFKFGRCTHRVHPNKSPLKFEENGTWAYPGTGQIFKYPIYYVRNG